MTLNDNILAALIDESPDVIFVKDLQGCYMMINAAGAAFFGRNRDEIVGQDDNALFDPATAASTLARDRRVIESGRALDFEEPVTVGDRTCMFHSTKVPLRDDTGKIVGVVGISRDTTERRAALTALQEAHQFVSEVISNAQEGIVVYDRHLRYLLWNPYMERLTGLPASEVVGRLAYEVVPQLRSERFKEFFERALVGETVRTPDLKYEVPETGKTGWRVSTFAPHRDAGGNIVGIIGVINEITDRKLTEEALRESEERYRDIFENANDIIFTLDLKGTFTSVNKAGEQVSGYQRDRVVAMNIAELIAPDHLDLARSMLQQKLSGNTQTRYELEIVAADGRRVPLEVNTRIVMRHGKPIGVQGIARDITERKRAEYQLEHLALFDALTDLPNRVLLNDRLQQAILAAQRDGSGVALLVMDLDRFKDVNDTFGHHYGDSLLQQVGPRIMKVLRESDTIARLGGDEFAMVLRDTNAAGAQQVAQKILGCLSVPLFVGGQSLDVNASIGIALFPTHGTDTATLLRQADIAMYVAKRNHLGVSVYSAATDEHNPDRLSLLTDLRRAITGDELVLVYQPKVWLATGKCERVEALVRWCRRGKEQIEPDRFIPLAEHTGLIKPLGLWVVREALKQTRRWHELGLRLHVAVNLSARGLHDPQLATLIGQFIRSCGASPNWLEVEITESAVMADPERSMQTLSRLRDMGIHISIDDFGTGYSSLAYLQRLPVDEIKIDKSFVTDMALNADNSYIVRSIVDLGHNLGMQVVAEGVEDAKTFNALRALGCDLAQGFYLCRPSSPETIQRWLENPHAVTRTDLTA